MNKVVSAQEAVAIIKDGQRLATSGFVGTCFAEELAIALKNRYLETGSPKKLSLIYAAGQGDGNERGLNHLAHEGLIKCVIGGHWGLIPKMQELAMNNKIEAYNLPQGVISHMFRAAAGHQPRVITKVGLQTFVDPKVSGGKINSITKEDVVEDIHIDGQRYLSYKAMPIDVAFIRGTTADENGNITMEKEALIVGAQVVAMAAKNSNGKVIVQVERIVKKHTMNPKLVRIPGVMVDYIVISKPENHYQTFATQYNPSYSGEVKIPIDRIKPMPLNNRKIIARRAAMELKKGAVVNLGIGMPEGVSSIAIEENIYDKLTLTTEPGVLGGMPAGGLDFGAGYNPECIMSQDSQFDFYDGGGLDIAFLGLAQTDKTGNLNVSKFGSKLAGAGGFINISQNSPTVVFMGTFTAGGLKTSLENNKLKILQEGSVKKFINEVEHITFSGKQAIEAGQTVLYITERAVFKLVKDGLQLIEIAPGIDLQKDILDHMEFKPIIKEYKVMSKSIFKEGLMNIETLITDKGEEKC